MRTETENRSKAAPVFSEQESKILNAFIQLCYELGSHNVSYAQVAQRAEVATTTVHYYFAPKDRDIRQAAILFMFQESYRFLEDEMMKRQMKNEDFNPLLNYVEVTFDWLEKKPAYASYMCFFYYLLTGKPETAVSHDIFLRRAYMRIESFIHECVGRQQVRKPRDMAAAVAQVHSLLTGCCLVATVSRNRKTFDHQREICLRSIEQILNANSVT